MPTCRALQMGVALFFCATALSASEIHDAVRSGDLERVRQIIENNAKALNEKDEGGEIPLHYVQKADVAEFLLSKGADPSAADKYNTTPLHRVVQNYEKTNDGDLTGVSSIMARIFFEQQAPRKDPAQILAVVKLLVGKGADIKAKDSEGRSPFFYCGFPDVASFLLEKGAGLAERDKSNNTPLHWASRKEISEVLLKKGADVEAVNNDKQTPLLLLASQKDVVELLLSKGAKIGASDSSGKTALHHAVEYDARDSVKLLISKGADANAPDLEGNTPLFGTIRGPMVELLVKSGAKIDARNDAGRTALHYVVANGDYDMSEIIQALLQNGAQMNAKDGKGKTPIHLAGSAHTIGLLMQFRADINARDNSGKTPLHYAPSVAQADAMLARGSKIEELDDDGNSPLLSQISFVPDSADDKPEKRKRRRVVVDDDDDDEDGKAPGDERDEDHAAVAKLLIRRGANAKIVNKFGSGAFHLASLKGHADLIKSLIAAGLNPDNENADGDTPLGLSKDAATAKAFVDAGADVRHVSKNGVLSGTPLHTAAAWGRTSTVEFLLEKGVDAEQKTNNGRTALFFASTNGSAECVAMLIKKGAQVNAADEHGFTPLHMAVQNGRAEVASILIQRGADVNAVAKHGLKFTPLDMAIKKPQIEKLLKEKGGKRASELK